VYVYVLQASKQVESLQCELAALQQKLVAKDAALAESERRLHAVVAKADSAASSCDHMVSNLKSRLTALSEELHQHKRREGSLRDHLRREVEDRHLLDTKERNLEYESRIKVRPGV
jgi:hypothetical protein